MYLLAIRSTQKLSGTETYNISLFRELSKDKKIKLEFLTNLDIFAEQLGKSGTNVHLENWLPVEVGTKKQLIKVVLHCPIFLAKYLLRIKALEAEKKFDIICLQSRTEMIFLTPMLKLLRYKVVWIQHGPFFKSQASKIIKLLYLLVSKSVDKIIVPSEDTKIDLCSGNLNQSRVKVIHIGLDTKLFNPYLASNVAMLRKNLGFDSKIFVIAFLGTLTIEKGTEDFIKTSKLLDYRNFKYLVIGDGTENKKMEQQMMATFTGFVVDVKKYLAIINLLLFPTHHYEATSIAILEAQAMGIPVLAYDKGGTREIITHGYNGFLYKEGDIDGIVRDIRMLNKNRKLFREMSKHARQRIVERFNIENQAKEFAKFFKSL